MKDTMEFQRDQSLNVQEALSQIKKDQSKKGPKLADFQHGDYVPGENGEPGGIVIDADHEKQKLIEKDRLGKSLIRLKDMDDPLFDSTNIDDESNLSSDESIEMIDRMIRENDGTYNPVVLMESREKLMEVKNEFASFKPTVNGLSEENTEDALNYERAMRDIRSGKVVLPTVEEYEKQKKDLEESIKKGKYEMEDSKKEVNQTNETVVPMNQPVEEKKSVQLDKSQLPDIDLRKENSSDSVNQELKEEPKNEELNSAIQKANEELANEVEQKKAPINLAELEHRKNVGNASNQSNVPTSSPTEDTNKVQAEPPKQTVQFNVPEDKVETFVATMPIEDREKVSQTKTIKINEVKEVSVPVATRRILDINEYKRIAPKRVRTEVIPVPLFNSRYIVYVKGCSSLEMAVLLPEEDGNINYAKRYQFCFDYIVATSIGQLTYRDFVAKTSPNDLSSIIYGIYRASEPDEQEIELSCGNQKCRKTYSIKYLVSSLIDKESYTDEMYKVLDEMTAVKDVTEDAIKYQKEHSVVMKQKCLKLTDELTITLCSTSGPTIIERYPKVKEISEKYNPYTSILILFVPIIWLTMIPDGETEPSVFEVRDTEVIAEEITKLSDDNLEIIRQELNTIEEFPAPTFSFKGPIKCPKCGRIEKSVSCEVEDLVFQKVSKAMSYV